MTNEYTELIKEKMKDFTQYYLTNEDEKIEFSVSNTEINPHLLSYIFDNILNFDVKYRIFEKLNYIITFKYKGKIGRIIHAKLSFKIYLENEIEKEVKDIFINVIDILEKALLKYSEDAVKLNNYSLPNYCEYYTSKICVIEKDINDLIKKIEKNKIYFREKEKNLIDSGKAYEKIIVNENEICTIIETPIQRLDNEFSIRSKELKIKLSYLIELYIDNYFSFIEHILSLIYPMTNYYNENEEFSKYLSSDWVTKLNKLNDNENYTDIIKSLSEIKEVYRNRFAHGLFSREKYVNVIVPDFGSYPLWIGKKYCRGYNGTSNFLNVEVYNKTKDIFNKFLEILINEYSLQWNIIKAGIPTFLKTKHYKDCLINEEKNKYWIEKYWYYQDNLLNMDW